VSVSPTALLWARIRAAGPLRVPASTTTPDGVLRLAEPGSEEVWLLPLVPEPAGPGVLGELELAGPAVEQPNDTARVLAACLRCCWRSADGSPWPGSAAPWSAVTAVFRSLTDREPGAFHRASLAAVRRLHNAGWVLWDEPAATVRLGPRVAAWSAADLSVLRELWRRTPPPPPLPAEDSPPAEEGS